MTRYVLSGRFVELYFDTVPDNHIREALKICGWRWYAAKKCWSNLAKEENIRLAKEFCLEESHQDDSTLTSRRRHRFQLNEVLVRSNSFFCNTHHTIEDMAGEIEVIERTGKHAWYLVPVCYCSSCNVYYILDETFKSVRRKGIIACQVIDFLKYRKYGKELAFTQVTLREESPLKCLGYSVNAEDGLTDEQRHAVLENIIDKGLMTKDRVLSYLDFFLKLNQHENSSAVYKWKSDRSYIETYNIGSVNRIHIDKVFVLC